MVAHALVEDVAPRSVGGTLIDREARTSFRESLASSASSIVVATVVLSVGVVLALVTQLPTWSVWFFSAGLAGHSLSGSI